METLDDVVARERRSDDLAIRVAGAREGSYTYHQFCTTAWKTGNFLRHLGVRDGVTVGIAADPLAQPVLGFFGAALLGATTRFAPPERTDARAVLALADDLDRYELPPGAQRAGYGEEPDDPSVRFFEREVWSENPSFPPVDRDPETLALTDGERSYSHRELVSGAGAVVEREGIEAGDVVAVRAPLADPGTVVAGVIAPLVAGATVLFPDDETVGDVAVTNRSAPEPQTIAPSVPDASEKS